MKTTQHATRALVVAVTALALVARHWPALVFVALLLLVAFVFAPRHMEGAMIVAGIVGAGIVIGHWWAA